MSHAIAVLSVLTRAYLLQEYSLCCGSNSGRGAVVGEAGKSVVIEVDAPTLPRC